MRIYLSHPYGGRPENKEKAAKIASMYRAIWDAEGKKNWEIVNPLSYFEPLAGTVDEDTILRVAVNLMLTCDGVLYAPGWKKSRGCRYEHMRVRAQKQITGATYYQAEIPEEMIA